MPRAVITVPSISSAASFMTALNTLRVPRGISTSSYPREENTREPPDTSPGTLNVKFPSRSDVVPTEVPFTKTDTPGTGAPAWSATVPRTSRAWSTFLGVTKMVVPSTVKSRSVAAESWFSTSVTGVSVTLMLTLCATSTPAAGENRYLVCRSIESITLLSVELGRLMVTRTSWAEARELHSRAMQEAARKMQIRREKVITGYLMW